MKVKKIHIILFLLTVLTTFISGLPSEIIVEGEPTFLESLGLFWEHIIVGVTSWHNVLQALYFCVALLFILGSHEMGHYYYGKKYGLDISPPYFIPAPPFISPIGTFGAFIKIQSPITTKKALFDIGIAGPLAGIIATLPILILGIMLSEIVEIPKSDNPIFIFGDPILISMLSDKIFGEIPLGYTLHLHPLAFAAWVGLFVTALNLIPSGQLDGGHITYALFSRKYHYYISVVMIFLLIIFGVGTEVFINIGNNLFGNNFSFISQSIPSTEGWPGWLLWAALLILMGGKHPPTMYEETNLGWERHVLGALSLLIFILCFTPMPIKIV